jgi:DNA polymerase III subunit delta'
VAVGNSVVAASTIHLYLPAVPLLTLYGHAALKKQLRDAATRNTLPASLLLHGPRGVGKQQLALWLARMLLCENADRAPCGTCKACRMAAELHHPDLHWFFPRPRLKGSDPDIGDIRQDIGEGIAERLENNGLYEPPGGDEALYVATVRAIVQTAVMSPAMGRRKVFVIGDAERMVAQEGSDQAANAFLKLLEEPPADTTLMLTSSEPGALLPTIRSRAVGVRVAPLAEADVRAFLADPIVANHLDLKSGSAESELLRLAAGAPGRLVAKEAWELAIGQARKLLDAARSPERGIRMRAALMQGASGARGKYADTLDALTALLHDRSAAAASKGDDGAAAGAARAIDAVEAAKEMTERNVNPQLVTAALLRQIAPLVR